MSSDRLASVRHDQNPPVVNDNLAAHTVTPSQTGASEYASSATMRQHINDQGPKNDALIASQRLQDLPLDIFRFLRIVEVGTYPKPAAPGALCGIRKVWRSITVPNKAGFN